MKATVIPVLAGRIENWESFHEVFQETLGFPDFYGRNMDAWIDCMTYVDDPGRGMTKVTVPAGALLILRIDDAADLSRRCPEQYRALVECSAFVNFRRMEVGDEPVLALLLGGNFDAP